MGAPGRSRRFARKGGVDWYVYEEGSFTDRERYAMVRGVTITMLSGEPTLVFWRIEDFKEAVDASRDMGLPVTSTKKVGDEIFRRLKRALMEYPEPEVGE